MPKDFEQEHTDNTASAQQIVESGAASYVVGEAFTGDQINTDAVSLLGNIHKDHPEIEERPYQLDCLNALARTRQNGHDKALIHMATGLGKTTVVATDVKRYLQENPESRVLFLCHQNEILKQARERFELIVGSENGETYGSFTGESKDMHKPTCLFASFQTMKNWREHFDEDEFDYIVVDESHHGKAETYAPTLEYFKPQFLLGLTATPDRQDLQDIREIFGREIYSKSLAQALAEKLLARPDYRVIVDDIQEGLLDDENISLAELNKKFFIPKRDEEITKIIQERVQDVKDPKMIIFCPSIEHSRRIADLLPGAKAFHSDLEKQERKDTLDEFKTGDVPALVTVDMFNEGMDIAEANVIVFLRSTQSETIFLQQLGRGLRKLPTKDSVLVLDFVANCDRLLMIEKLLHDTMGRYEGQGESSSRPSTGELDEFESWDTTDLYSLEFKDIEDEIDALRDLKLGSFEFTETTRKILDIVRNMTRLSRNFQPAKEGWLYVGQLAEEAGCTRQTIIKIARDMGVNGTNMVGSKGSHVGLYFSPEHSEILAAKLGSIPEAPEDWISQKGLQQQYGLNPYTTAKVAQELDIAGTVMKGKHGQQGIFYSEVEQKQILEAASKLERADDEWLNISSITKLSQLSHPTIARIVKELGLTGTLMRDSTGHEVVHYSPEERVQILSEAEKRVSVVPEGWLSASLIQKQYGIHARVVDRIAKQLGIDGRRLRTKLGKETAHYSPDETESIIQNAPSRSKLDKAPEGYMSALSLAKQTGMSDETIARRADKLGLAWETYKNSRGKEARFLSPENIQHLQANLDKEPDITPEGYMSLKGLAENLEMAESTIKRITRELGLTAVRYREPSTNNVFGYFSPEQITEISQSEYFGRTTPPEGYMYGSEITEIVGVTLTTVNSAVKKMGLTPSSFMHPKTKRTTAYFSPEQIEQIRDYFGA